MTGEATISNTDYGPAGPNLAKRVQQRKVLGRILRASRAQRPLGTPFRVLCLPGAACWDTDFFLGFDFVTEAVALERDSEVAAVLRARYADPESRVVVVEASVGAFLVEETVPFDLVYLDYFSNFNFGVEADLKLIFRRRLLNPGGKCVVNFLAARESEQVQLRNRLLYEDLSARIGGEPWAELDPSRQRRAAFNALISSLRHAHAHEPPEGDVEGGSQVRRRGRRTYARCTAPQWSSYPTVSASMLTASFTCNGYARRAGSYVEVNALDRWLARTPVEEHRPRSLNGVTRMKGMATAAEWWRARIKAFYEKNHYTPACHEIHKRSVNGWNDHVRAVGLCPRKNATREEICQELLRIAAREGHVTWTLARKAKLTGRALFSLPPDKPRKTLEILCKEIGAPYEVRSIGMQNFHLRCMARLQAWIEWLESGRRGYLSPHYRWASDRGLREYEAALIAWRAFQKDLHAGLYPEWAALDKEVAASSSLAHFGCDRPISHGFAGVQQHLEKEDER